jgi:hypothetical protein
MTKLYDILAVLGFFGALAAAEPTQVGQIADLVERYGITVVLLIYFVLRDWSRAKADNAERANLVQRLRDLEDRDNKETKELAKVATMALKTISENWANHECVARVQHNLGGLHEHQ